MLDVILRLIKTANQPPKLQSFLPTTIKKVDLYATYKYHVKSYVKVNSSESSEGLSGFIKQSIVVRTLRGGSWNAPPNWLSSVVW